MKDYVSILAEFLELIKIFLITSSFSEKVEAPVFTRPLTNKDCREGRPFSFDVGVKGIPSPEITWYINQKIVETDGRYKLETKKAFADIQHTFKIDPVEMEDAGKIKAVAKNKAGSVETEATFIVEGKVLNYFCCLKSYISVLKQI